MAKKRSYFPAITIILAGTILLSACSSQQKSSTNEEDNTVQSEESLGYTSEIDKNSIMSIEITASQDDWSNMLEHASDKEYIPADVTINGTTIKNVGIKPKGNSSLKSIVSDENSDRYSFKIKFDEYVDGQTYKGLDKLVLNNNYSDPTSMKEYLSYDILNYIDVATPLYSYADISINGESWGFYLALEAVDESYLERTTGGEGDLYKPDSMEDNNNKEGKQQQRTASPGEANGGPKGGGMESDDAVGLIYTDDEESSYASIFDNSETKTDSEDHKRVITAIKNLNEGTDLETYVDVDEVLRYLAAHTAVVNLDSYSSNMGHNYYLYENNGQISMLPWDYNMSFGGFHVNSASSAVNFPIDTPVSGVSMEDRPMISKLLEQPEYLEKYHQYLQQIIDEYFAEGKFEQKVDQINAMISEHVKNDPSAFYTYEEYEAAVAEFKKLGELRGQSMQGQLDKSIPSTTEGQSADSSKLIDSSSIDMSILGDSGPENGGPGNGGPGNGGPGNGGPGNGGPRNGGPGNGKSGKEMPDKEGPAITGQDGNTGTTKDSTKESQKTQ